MKYLGPISDDKDIVNKKYVDDSINGQTYFGTISGTSSGGTTLTYLISAENYIQKVGNVITFIWPYEAGSHAFADIALNINSTGRYYVYRSGSNSIADYDYLNTGPYVYSFVFTGSAYKLLYRDTWQENSYSKNGYVPAGASYPNRAWMTDANGMPAWRTIDTGGDHEELTQAEYDALSQAEKENGTVYFITDGEPDYTIINDSVPIGAIQAYAGASLPYGWLFCDGAAVSRETYSELFAAIGTAYGPGDGSTTFNLPDLRGKVLIGESSSYAIGSNGGEATHTLTVNEMPSHRHAVLLDNDYSLGEDPHYGGRDHPNCAFITDGNWYGYEDNKPSRIFAYMYFGHTNDSGNNAAHNNMQPYLVGNYIIKALNTVSSSALEELDPQHILFDMFYPVGSYYETSDATFDPNEQWRGTWVLETAGQVHVSAGTGYNVGDTGGEATHTLTVNEMPSHDGHMYSNEAVTIPDQHENTYYVSSSSIPQYGTWKPWVLRNGNELVMKGFDKGGSQSHNNMQPYIVVNRWHRTA